MAEITELNSVLNNVTLINEQLQMLNGANGSETMINPLVVGLTKFQSGICLNDKYKIINQLKTESGEADLYLCEYNGRNYIAKVYKHDRANKAALTELLLVIQCPYIAPIVEMFELDGMQIEILPYYSKGSLQGHLIKEDVLKGKIIPDLIEGLKVLHDHGVVHRDIKPSNIMWAENGEDVVIIDFGISSLLNGNTIVKTKTGLTLVYAAPETLANISTPLSDYYSLGITVYELLFGKTPYGNMSQEELDEYFSIQNIPMPNEVSDDFRDLLRGLTYFDIRNRKDETNPNCRWGYNKVKAWCEGVKQVVPGTGFGGISGDMPQYRFRGNTYLTRESLTHAIVEFWDEGKAELYRGKLTKAFRTFDVKSAEVLQAYEDEYENNQELSDLIFWKALYEINSGTHEFYWKHQMFKDLNELGKRIIEGFQDNSFEIKRMAEEIIRYKLVSQYIKIVAPDNNYILIESIEALENRCNKAEGTREKVFQSFILGYMISKEKLFAFDGKSFASVQEFINHVMRLRAQSVDHFEVFCKKLISIDNELTPQFEAWLIANNKQEILHRWKRDMN